MTIPHELKQGNTFSVLITLDDSIPTGQFDGWDAIAEIRKKNNPTSAGLIATLEVYPIGLPADNRYLLFYQNTSKWPLGVHQIDLKFVHDSGYTVHSKTFDISMVNRITR